MNEQCAQNLIGFGPAVFSHNLSSNGASPACWGTPLCRWNDSEASSRQHKPCRQDLGVENCTATTRAIRETILKWIKVASLSSR